MDRLVKVDVKELELTFNPGQRCSATFRLTNLMHTMSVAVSLTATPQPSLFSFAQAQQQLHHPFSILPPLSSSPFSLLLSQLSDNPPLSSPSHTLLVRTSMLPTGKANPDDFLRIFSNPGPQVFKDAAVPIFFVGSHVAQFLLSPFRPVKTLEVDFLLSKAISRCTVSQLTTLLRSSVRCGNPSHVSTLIDAGGDVNSRDSDGQSLMSLAVSSGHIDVVRVLLVSGYQIDHSADRFLHEAAALNQIDLMDALYRGLGGINVNSVNPVGRTPVHVSASHGHIDLLEFCLSKGGNPELADSNGWTPLHCAAADGHVKCVELLLEHSRYSKYAMTKDGKTAFSLAIDNGHSHSDLLDLLRLGDVLQRAARLDDVHGMKSCLAQGAKVNGRDQNGWTPLHRAAFKGRLESVKLLLSHGAEVDLVDDAGYTPLHCAVEAGHTEVALYLISHGACANLKSFMCLCSPSMDNFKNHPASISLGCRENERRP
ncbi:PREDICTED: ankyrin-2-like [Nelumbo nucifera]|uniref:Ankyrin-2-like n=1 Tax=Nelumbo nucifera TaxID=4432 RepID=A0A1U8BGV5_NELNU|nr:PREDICTED: ankyrin-2-like [Nelumbo nucifera]